MTTDSSTGGYLAPVSSSLPLEDAALDAVLQGYVVGVTGMDGSLVRPRWQPTVPKQPAPNVNWCAIGVADSDRDVLPTILHDQTGDGSDDFIRNEVMSVLASFYGPNAKQMATIFADGIQVPQNKEAIASNGLALIDSGKAIAAPELVNEQWIRRYDITIRLRRQIVRTYRVLNILSVDGAIQSDQISDSFNVPR